MLREPEASIGRWRLTVTVDDLDYPPISGLVTPRFVPSVSGAAKSDLTIQAHIRALVEWRSPSLLVSAYDLEHLSDDIHTEVIRWLEEAVDQGTSVFLDSGGYEARWLRDTAWSLPAYHRCLLEAPHSVAFTFDLLDDPPVEALEKTAERLGSSSGLIPIVHGTGREAEEEVARLSQFEIAGVAVTERDLGAGIWHVAAALRGIAAASGAGIPVHVLGAGHPLSILAYVAAGAASFDGLDWCQTVADPATGTMHHAKQLPFFLPDVSPEIGDYSLQLLGHNLMFYDEWMTRIREALGSGTLDSMLTKHLSRTVSQ